MAKKLGRIAFEFEKKIYINGWGNCVGKKEQEGPLGSLFDQIEEDFYCGKDTLEKAEVHLQKMALEHALRRSGCNPKDLELAAAGDLLNQCISSAYHFRNAGVPYIGLYGACSTMALSTLVAGMSLEAGISKRSAAVTSSHFGTAERQFRFPLEYGGQRPPAAQHTVTGSGALVLGLEAGPIQVVGGAFGAIIDREVTDMNNMGGAMAPAALFTITEYLKETGTSPADYDGIFTGDLGEIGHRSVIELAALQGIDLAGVYEDCGLLIYDQEKQDMHAGASGCGCSASVLTAYILPKLVKKEWKRVLFLSTGALMSPLSVMQGESIPGIAHLVHLEGVK